MPLTPHPLYVKWTQNGVPSDVSWSDVQDMAKHYGFEIRDSNHGHMLKHSVITTQNGFKRSYLTISEHAHGKQGQVEPDTVKPLLKAIKLIMEMDEA